MQNPFPRELTQARIDRLGITKERLNKTLQAFIIVVIPLFGLV